MIPANRAMLSGGRVYRIHWVLGTDRLRAVCHCSAEREFEDPVQLWEWLLAHPAGHDPTETVPESPHTRQRVLDPDGAREEDIR